MRVRILWDNTEIRHPDLTIVNRVSGRIDQRRSNAALNAVREMYRAGHLTPQQYRDRTLLKVSKDHEIENQSAHWPCGLGVAEAVDQEAIDEVERQGMDLFAAQEGYLRTRYCQLSPEKKRAGGQAARDYLDHLERMRTSHASSQETSGSNPR